MKPTPACSRLLIDAHNHLQDERFGGHQARRIAEAQDAGVRWMVVNGSCEEDWPAVADLADRFPGVIPSFGYHPWYIHQRSQHWLERLKEILNHPRSVVGEIGLDRWKPGLAYEGQEEVFLAQMQLASEKDVAASLHCLKAWGRLHDLLRQGPRPRRGFLLHSYGGPVEMVAPLARLGAYFSFPGYFMHERKVRQRETFRSVPLDRLLIETDAPDQLLPDDLNPHPLTDPSGKPINHPANLGTIHEYLAHWLAVPCDELASRLLENGRALFGLPTGPQAGAPACV